jgi:periplasmic protein TonB
VNAGLTTTLLTSIVLHLLGLTALSMVSGSLWPVTPPPNLIPAEMLVEPPPPAVSEPVPLPEPEPLAADPVEQAEPVPPPPEPEPQPVTPPKLEKIIPPKLVEKPMPERVVPRPKPVHPVSRVRRHEPAASPPPGAASPEPPGSPVPLPAGAQAPVGGNVLGPPVERPPETAPPPPVEGGEAGAGKLFDKGDVGVVPGAGAGGGSGGPGRAGLGTGGPGASGGTRVAGLPPGAGLGGDSGVARPLGGYQVKPRYPESARRQGVEGTTLLKIHVNDTGRVEDVLVERSAGHEDLDLAAIEAVKQWRFEPARRGKQSVAVWVMLPVRFALK